jgi:hypothetical protein
MKCQKIAIYLESGEKIIKNDTNITHVDMLHFLENIACVTRYEILDKLLIYLVLR